MDITDSTYVLLEPPNPSAENKKLEILQMHQFLDIMTEYYTMVDNVETHTKKSKSVGCTTVKSVQEFGCNTDAKICVERGTNTATEIFNKRSSSIVLPVQRSDASNATHSHQIKKKVSLPEYRRRTSSEDKQNFTEREKHHELFKAEINNFLEIHFGKLKDLMTDLRREKPSAMTNLSRYIDHMATATKNLASQTILDIVNLQKDVLCKFTSSGELSSKKMNAAKGVEKSSPKEQNNEFPKQRRVEFREKQEYDNETSSHARGNMHNYRDDERKRKPRLSHQESLSPVSPHESGSLSRVEFHEKKDYVNETSSHARENKNNYRDDERNRRPRLSHKEPLSPLPPRQTGSLSPRRDYNRARSQTPVRDERMECHNKNHSPPARLRSVSNERFRGEGRRSPPRDPRRPRDPRTSKHLQDCTRDYRNKKSPPHYSKHSKRKPVFATTRKHSKPNFQFRPQNQSAWNRTPPNKNQFRDCVAERNQSGWNHTPPTLNNNPFGGGVTERNQSGWNHTPPTLNNNQFGGGVTERNQSGWNRTPPISNNNQFGDGVTERNQSGWNHTPPTLNVNQFGDCVTETQYGRHSFEGNRQ